MKELVSIIVPVYRAAAYIAETIAMVEAQTWQDWELILVDDCSPDNSAEVIRNTLRKQAGWDNAARQSCEGVQPEVRTEMFTGAGGQPVMLLQKQKNEGAARARNTGLDMAQGRYIAFLDADDVWYPEKLEREMRFMRQKEAGFVFTAYEFGDSQARPTGRVVHVPERLTYRQALSRTVIFTTTVLFDRKRIPDRLLRMPAVASEDTATWWQILQEGYTAWGLNEVLAVYRRPAKSLSSNKAEAVRRIWNLYRRQEKLSVAASAGYFIMWAYRATKRRI
ncbi:MAG: glycosyltransferase family 2 protein [Lachnospiraceae bacterium]|jgi:teichuronic acid biosynthesis glycosyltransferase TuaG|nr:glycosyltransferase family 2 protein [Lachnospiraceae bacterium]